MTAITETTTNRVKVVIERFEDGYVAYPLGMKGVVIGQGDSYQEAMADVTSAIQAHLKQFGSECLQEVSPVESRESLFG